MLRTITLGSSVSIQGVFVESMADGRIRVQVDNTIYSGVPVTKK